jgi:hypothetical protein
VSGVRMRDKIGLQTRYDCLSPVGIYETVARVRTDIIRDNRVREQASGCIPKTSLSGRP